MNHNELIHALGGPHAVHAALAARSIKIKPVAVRAWALADRSIPAKYWVDLAEVAAERGVSVSFEDLAAGVRARPGSDTVTN